jgi:alpha-ketoglutarate-dependent taurine dioxygenase
MMMGKDAYANAARKQLALGMEIRGIRLAEHLADDGLFERIKADCYRHRLLVFREQGQLPADALLKMFEGFGDIYHQPYTTQTKDMTNHMKAPAKYVLLKII